MNSWKVIYLFTRTKFGIVILLLKIAAPCRAFTWTHLTLFSEMQGFLTVMVYCFQSLKIWTKQDLEMKENFKKHKKKTKLKGIENDARAWAIPTHRPSNLWQGVRTLKKEKYEVSDWFYNIVYFRTLLECLAWGEDYEKATFSLFCISFTLPWISVLNLCLDLHWK